MGLYRFEYWFRYANYEKDFDIIDVKAHNEEEADRIIRKKNKRVFKTVFIKKLN
jgi:hypothetical protein